MGTNTFTCQSKTCGKIATTRGLIDVDGPHYVDCSHCGARHEIVQQPTQPGAPLEFRVVGLAKPK